MNNLTAKKLLPFANGFIVLSLMYYWLETSAFINPVAIILIGIFALHFFVAKGGFKFIFPTLFILINLYMFLALFSEFSEFESLNKQSLTLLLVGGLYLGLNIVSAVIMILSNKSTIPIPEEAG